ncbi:MAG: SDR family NAD(P)-dependent oxidoreductase [Elusimicrobia bacterium]|nr:SDR family NAD(P)-dependent oxidoreductase [Elusimicrobiota bacterium]
MLSVLITGGARRVGAAIAELLARRKANHIILHANRSVGEARRLSAKLRNLGARKVSVLSADLSRHPQVSRLGRDAFRLEPSLNAVVFNASVYEETPFGGVREQDWDRHLDINLKSVFFLAQQLGPAMKKKNGGRMVLIGDWAGLRPYAQYIPYCLSKTGILYLTQALAKALAPEVAVNAVLPGPVLLPPDFTGREIQLVRQATLLKKLGTPEAVAKAVRFFLEEADFSTGAWLTVDGGRLIA